MKSLIIIGGGILGASTAYEAAKAGAEVTLIDRKDDPVAFSQADDLRARLHSWALFGQHKFASCEVFIRF